MSHPVLKSKVPFCIKRITNLSGEQIFKSWSSTLRQRFNELFRGGFSACVNWFRKKKKKASKKVALSLYNYTVMISPCSAGELLSSNAVFHVDYLDVFFSPFNTGDKDSGLCI